MTTLERWGVALVATAVLLTCALPVVHAQNPGAAGGMSTADRMANAKTSLKTRFGFSDAQATTAINKVQAVTKSYQPRITAMQAAMRKKYGASPTPAQQRDAIPLIMEITKKTNAVLLGVATKAQRPKLEAQFKSEQAMLQKMAAGGTP